MLPENVNTKNFIVNSIIYNTDNFTIAHGKWKDDNHFSIGMRWNGEDNTLGFPQVFGNPQWFILDSDLNRVLLSALLNHNISNTEELIKAIDLEFK